jgi:regulator of replication initiation timing
MDVTKNFVEAFLRDKQEKEDLRDKIRRLERIVKHLKLENDHLRAKVGDSTNSAPCSIETH